MNNAKHNYTRCKQVNISVWYNLRSVHAMYLPGVFFVHVQFRTVAQCYAQLDFCYF